MNGNSDFKKTEALLNLVADSSEFIDKKDKMSVLLGKYDEYMDDELSEADLEFAVAARKPDIPAYKLIDEKEGD